MENKFFIYATDEHGDIVAVNLDYVIGFSVHDGEITVGTTINKGAWWRVEPTLERNEGESDRDWLQRYIVHLSDLIFTITSKE